ncbi:hypothetical protein SAMN05444159_0286 [Bradyrhizobium lablabi]|uniref:Uncharacterized protein n=2 Tax=Bradyrhizobium lablabi TaxID=722472 RepID=A0A1M6IAW6_9BRAD|nr:hypothetical protein SAMN05444159_0286 [Bradyrhizobium lablabi]
MMSASAEEPLIDTAGRLAFMRQHMRPYWFSSEAGGIYLATSGDVDANARIFNEFLRRVPETAAATEMRDRWAILQNLMVDDLTRFFATAKLPPGQYELDNYHLAEAVDGKLAFDMHGHAPIELPPSRLISFVVTNEHLRLIPRMNTRMWQNLVEIMDAKRPYGDMSNYYVDIADALGESPLPRDHDNQLQLTRTQEDRYLDLHRSMLFAVQAFWLHAR